jgi:hypothetical protein
VLTLHEMGQAIAASADPSDVIDGSGYERVHGRERRIHRLVCESNRGPHNWFLGDGAALEAKRAPRGEAVRARDAAS